MKIWPCIWRLSPAAVVVVALVCYLSGRRAFGASLCSYGDAPLYATTSGEFEYIAIAKLVSRAEATAACGQLDGYLVTIQSEGENSLVYNLVVSTASKYPIYSNGAGAAAWIGVQVQPGGSVEDATGAQVTYENWAPGEPDTSQYYPQLGSCGVMGTLAVSVVVAGTGAVNTAYGQWGDDRCDRIAYYFTICKRPLPDDGGCTKSSTPPTVVQPPTSQPPSAPGSSSSPPSRSLPPADGPGVPPVDLPDTRRSPKSPSSSPDTPDKPAKKSKLPVIVGTVGGVIGLSMLAAVVDHFTTGFLKKLCPHK